MSPIAIFYEGTIIYWSSIVIAAGILAGFALSLSLFVAKNKYAYTFCLFFPVALVLSIYLSRIIHWYCNTEQYDGFDSAVTNLQKGSFLVPGILISVWLVAMIMHILFLVKSRYTILDPLAPGLAFIIAVIRFSSIFSDACRGKATISNKAFQHLPFAIKMLDPSGEIQYRFATFFVSFLLMLGVTALLIWFYMHYSRKKKKAPLKSYGHTFRAFLVLYGAVEIVMDSTRYDASHLYFPGEALASLNKGAGFMGLSQMIGALSCLYVFIYYLVMTIKANGRSKKIILPVIMFVLGLGIGGTAEYLVQRFTSMALPCYLMQTFGVILIIISIFILFRSCIDTSKGKKRAS